MTAPAKKPRNKKLWVCIVAGALAAGAALAGAPQPIVNILVSLAGTCVPGLDVGK